MDTKVPMWPQYKETRLPNGDWEVRTIYQGDEFWVVDIESATALAALVKYFS